MSFFRNRNKGLSAAVLLTAAGLLSASDALPVIENGTSKAVFVLPDNAGQTEKLAAQEFCNYVEKITGVRVRTADKTGAGAVTIRLSLCTEPGLPDNVKMAGEKLRYDGFILDVSKDGIRIISAKKRGLLYGVYYLLREYGGVIWFHPDPTDEGEFVPKSAHFRIPFQLTVKNPEFELRRFILNGGSTKNDHVYKWFVRNGMQVFSGNISDKNTAAFDPVLIGGGHEMNTLLVGYPGTRAATAALLKEHPEYFGMDSHGVRRPGGNFKGAIQPCTSNPEVLKRMGDHALGQIARFKGRENIRELCDDDHMAWCQCPECRKQDDPQAPSNNRHADRWWHFVNYMAGRIMTPDHPENRLSAYLYQSFRMPPRTVKPDPRVSVTVCPHQRCYIHALTDPECTPNAATFRKMFEAWHQMKMRGNTFEYHTQLPGATRYLPMEKAWVEDLRFYKKMNMEGYSFVTRAPFGGWSGKYKTPFNEYMWLSLWQQHWLTAHYSWDIGTDFDAVNDKINAAYYGAAWKYMKPYRKELEKALLAPKVHMGYGTSGLALGRCGDSAGLFEHLHGYLDQAEKAVAGDKLRLKRIRRDRLFLKLNWEKAYSAYQNAKQREYNAKSLKGSLKIDGRLDEDAWRTADVISGFKVNSKQAASPQTFVRILYDSGNLYFGIEAMKAKAARPLDVAMENGIPGAMKGSYIEIFLTPPELKGKYYHFGFTHNGKSFQALTDSASARDENVKIGFSYRISEQPDRWVAEVKAPVGKLVGKVKDGSTWKLNIARVAVTDQGKQEASSMCNGVFHGSEAHRTLAFGEKGAIVRNGDFEDVGKPKIKKHLKKQWEYVSGNVPLHWDFNENNTGKIEMRSDSPSSGKYYLHVSGVNAFVEQGMTIPGNKPERYAVGMMARGKGTLLIRLRKNGKYSKGILQKIDSEKWIPVHGVIDLVPDAKRIVFTCRITGTLDLDDTRVTAEAPEDMPDAAKHSEP